MALGKAAKQARNRWEIVKPKLDRKLVSDEFYEELKGRDVSKGEKFKLFVYGHEQLGGAKLDKDAWLNHLDRMRKLS